MGDHASAATHSLGLEKETSLRHSVASLASPVGAGVHADDDPAREELLLQRPPSGVENSINCGAVSYVAAVDMNKPGRAIRASQPLAEGHLVVFGSAVRRETTKGSVRSLSSGDCQLTSLVNLRHLDSFVVPFLFLVLDDAERVDLNVRDFQRQGYVYSIEESLWKKLLRDFMAEGGKCCFCGE